jgi:hypothetical protein
MEDDKMNEEQKKLFDLCKKFESCSAPVCPLYVGLLGTRHIPGDRRCVQIVSYIDGTPMTPELHTAIASTEKTWRSILGEKLLERWTKERKTMRQVFQKAV